MSSFFSSDSRTPGWVKIVLLVALMLSCIGTFIGLQNFLCGESLLLAGIVSIALALLVFVTVPRCSMELEKWGRFKSNGVVWALFFFGILGATGMALGTLLSLKVDQKWEDMRSSYEDIIIQGVQLNTGYLDIKDVYFQVLRDKMNDGLYQAQMGAAPRYMYSCPVFLDNTTLSKRIVDKRFETLKGQINAAEGGVPSSLHLQEAQLNETMTQIGHLQRCEVADAVRSFKATVERLDLVMIDHIARTSCPLVAQSSHGPWLARMTKYKATQVPEIQLESLMKESGVFPWIWSVLLLLAMLGPILLARALDSGTKTTGGTEI
jgi:hypothetical protein